MKHKRLTRLVSMLLVLATLFSLVTLPAGAKTLGDSGSVKIKADGRHEILKKSTGGTFGSDGWDFTSNDGITGTAYCVNWGLKSVSPNKSLPLEPYNRKPRTMGAFANGYPQRSLEQFKELHKDEVRGIDELTKGEYQYATQIAVWATCGQLSVPGTNFTSGRASVVEPTSSAKQIRVFDSVKAILKQTATWTRHLATGMSIRAEENKDVRGVEVINENGLEGASSTNQDGIKKETINGKEYYTRVMYVASATSTWIDDYKTKIYSSNAPEGTIFVAENNSALETVEENGATCYKVDTSKYRYTDLNGNGMECYGAFKVCIPADNVTNEGSFTIKATGGVAQYNLFLAKNSANKEQSYIIADPAYTTVEGQGEFKWSGSNTPDTPASLQVVKAGAGGAPLEGAKFTLTGSGGTTREGETDRNGQIIWKDLPADEQYTLTETSAPEGYQIVAPMNVKVTAGKTEYVTIADDTEKGFTVKKIDAQNKGSLQGAVFRFEQIDGDYVTTGTTGFDGTISFQGDELPYGSYRVTEETPPDGYQKDKRVETVVWDGKKDVLLTFEDVRDISLLLVKLDADTGVSLAGATFDVYADGEKITSVTTNNAGEARITGIKKEAYIEVVETVAPDGYVLNTQAQTITVKNSKDGTIVSGATSAGSTSNELVFENSPTSTLVIEKFVEGTNNEPLKGVEFLVTDGAGAPVGPSDGHFYTDKDGRITVTDLEPGMTIIAKETKTVEGYVLDGEPQSIKIKTGKVQNLTFWNKPAGVLVIQKKDKISGKPLAGVEFELTYAGGGYVDNANGHLSSNGRYTTDAKGEIRISGITGTVVAKEVKTIDGYVIDPGTQTQTVKVNPADTQTLTFYNEPFCGMTIIKQDSTNRKPLANAEFIVKDSTGNVVGRYTTNKDGIADVNGLVPGQTYVVSENKAPAGYALNAKPKTITVKNGAKNGVVS